jgi:hypothetical protein
MAIEVAIMISINVNPAVLMRLLRDSFMIIGGLQLSAQRGTLLRYATG